MHSVQEYILPSSHHLSQSLYLVAIQINEVELAKWWLNEKSVQRAAQHHFPGGL